MASGIGRVWERNGVWYYAWSHRGRETRRSTGIHGSEKMARRLLQERFKAIGKGYEPTQDRLTFDGMVERLRLESKDRKTDDIDRRVSHLRTYFGDYYAPEVSDLAIMRYKQKRIEENAAPATINRELGCLRHMMRVCKVFPLPTFKLLPENNARKDFLSGPDFTRVHSALPESFKGIFMFLYVSSWRQTQASLLEWRDVGADTITARRETTKNGQPQTLPITDEIRPVIEAARLNRRLDCPLVFHKDGQKINWAGKAVRNAWKKACDVTGFHGHWIHCLRRSAVRNMINAGVDPHTAMSVTGHKSSSMLSRYHIITVDDQRRALEKTAQYVENVEPSKVVRI